MQAALRPDYDDILNGNVPEEISSDPLKLTALWSALKQNDPSIASDPTAEIEWLSLVAARRKSGIQEKSLQMVPEQKVAASFADKVKSGAIGGMGELDAFYFRKNLLKLEDAQRKAEIQDAVKSGNPVKPQPPRGWILNNFPSN